MEGYLILREVGHESRVGTGRRVSLGSPGSGYDVRKGSWGGWSTGKDTMSKVDAVAESSEAVED